MSNKIFTDENITEAYNEFYKELEANKNDASQNKIKLKELFRRLVFILIARRFFSKKVEEKIDYSKVQNVLLMRNDGLGDYIQTTPLINLLKHINPAIQIDIICSERNSVLIQQDEQIRNCFLLNSNTGFIKLIKFCRQIKAKFKYDVFIALKHTSTTKNAFIGNLIASQSNKISFSHNDTFRNKSYSLVFNHLIEYPKLPLHWSDTLLKLIYNSSSNQIVGFKKSAYILNKKFTEAHAHKETILSKEQIKMLINISAFETNRKFEVHQAVEMIKYLSQIPKFQIYITSSPKEINLAQDIVNQVNCEKCVLVSKDLIDLINELPFFDILISPDTGIVHFADALKISIIAFYQNYDKITKWHPLKSRFVGIIPENGNFNKLNIQEIAKALEYLGVKLN
jgi:ADP-heptose:LPS heptosyltransferase